jgi:hypothetical protein
MVSSSVYKAMQAREQRHGVHPSFVEVVIEVPGLFGW